MMIVLSILGFLSFVGLVVFGIMGIVSLVQKNGKAMRNIIIASLSLVVFIGVTVVGVGGVVYKVFSETNKTVATNEESLNEVENDGTNNTNRNDFNTENDNTLNNEKRNEQNGFTVEEEAWLEEVGVHASGIGSTMDTLGQLLLEPKVDDPDWESEIEREFDALREHAEAGMDIEAPTKRTKEVMETYRNSMKEYKWVAEEMPKAMDQNDEAKMNEGGHKIDKGNELMMKATKQAEQLHGTPDNNLM